MVKISGMRELQTAFSKLVDAALHVVALKSVRDAKKQAADDAYTKEAEKYQQVFDEWEVEVETYCNEHRHELLPAGKKSAKIGGVTIRWKYANPVLETLGGNEPEPASVLEAIESYINETRSDEVRATLEKCIDYKPKLLLEEVKNLPDELLKRMNLRVVQVEKFIWKANAEK